MKYIKKPIPIEAIQWNGSNRKEILNFMDNNCPIFNEIGEIIIHTLEGEMAAPIGSYIVKGVDGEFYPCRKRVFEDSYMKIYEYSIVCKKCHKQFTTMKNNLFYDDLNKIYKYWDICPHCNKYNEWEVGYDLV